MNIASNPKNKKKDSDECITKFVHVGLSPKKKEKFPCLKGFLLPILP